MRQITVHSGSPPTKPGTLASPKPCTGAGTSCRDDVQLLHAPDTHTPGPGTQQQTLFRRQQGARAAPHRCQEVSAGTVPLCKDASWHLPGCPHSPDFAGSHVPGEPGWGSHSSQPHHLRSTSSHQPKEPRRALKRV